ncbi:MAG: hypothetical protein Q4P33_09150 [Flaviflexus sp.]|nr:hypothetical protein [Flaviflexus sp.]
MVILGVATLGVSDGLARLLWMIRWFLGGLDDPSGTSMTLTG